MNNAFKDLRIFIYDYHLNGLDGIQENQSIAVRKIIAMLPSLKQMDKQKLGSIFPNSYFSTKADEITNIISLSDPLDQLKAYQLLIEIDPANISKYELLRKN